MHRFRTPLTRWFILLTAILLSISLLPSQPVYAAAITVTTSADTVAVNGSCSLREAIANANNDAATNADCTAGSGADTISFSGVVTPINISTELSISSDITFNGTGITVDNTGTGRVFNITGGTVIMNGLTITGGDSSTGAGIQISGGSLTLQNGVTVTGNATGTTTGFRGSGLAAIGGAQVLITGSGTAITGNGPSWGGGGIYILGGADVTVSNGATVSNNTVSGGGNGGGVSLAGAGTTLTIDNATVSGNTVAGAGGGGLYAQTSAEIILQNGAVISNNSADFGGGMYIGASTVTITNTTFSGNVAATSGGAIYKTGVNTLEINGSAFTGNSSSGNGGAIYNNQGSLTVTSSRLESNTAANGGAYYTVSGTTGASDSLTGSCIVNNGDTAVVDTEVSNDMTATGNWWGTIWGPQIVGAGGGSAISGGDSISGDGVATAADSISDVDVGLINAGTADGSIVPSGNWLTSAPTIAGATCASVSWTPPTPSTPDVTISPASFNVNEGANADFTITRTGSTASALNVTVNITLGTGTVDADYDLSGGSIPQTGSGVTVTIPAGSASVNVNFAALDDVDAEADNTLSITLVDDAAYNLGATTSSIATIPANDLVVTNTNNSGDGSLRQAITNANAFSTNDTITFTAGANGTITMQSNPPEITPNGTLTVDGNGPGITIISGNGSFRGFTLQASGTLTILDLTIRDGSNSFGGGVYAGGVLNVSNVHFINNTASTVGGAIFLDGTVLNVSNSVFYGNSSIGGGGAIRSTNNNGGSVTGTLTNNLFYNNSAATNGGAAFFLRTGTYTVTNNTVTNNSSGVSSIIIDTSATVNLRNSIVANNSGGSACVRIAGIINVQNSLIEDGSCSITNGVNGNLTGDPALNGDYTLSSSSIAIDAGSDALIPGGVTTDLAGNARIQGLRVDMGAYESSFTATPIVTINPAAINVNEGSSADFTITRTGSTASALNVTVNITLGTDMVDADYDLSGGSIPQTGSGVTVTIPAGSASVNVNFAALDDVDAEADNTLSITLVDGAAYDLGATTSSIATIPANDLVVTNTNDSGDGSLRQAITNANAFSTNDTITFTAVGSIGLTSALPDLANNGTLTINGGGTMTVTRSSGTLFRIFTVASGANVTLNGLTITGGYALDGGGINNGGTLNLNNSTVSANTTNNGGGINNSGTLNLNNSTVSANTATGNGGGIYNIGTVTLNNSTVSANTSNVGGAIYNAGAGTVTLNNSTVSANTADIIGGGIFNIGTVTLNNSIVANSNGGDCAGAGVNAYYSLIEDGTCGVVSGTNGNLTGDPALNGDYTLSSSSIAIDAGSDALIPGGVTTDLAGNARIQGLRVDMGAYESSFTATPIVTINPAAINVNEGSSADFTITRTGSTASALNVTVNITLGTDMVDADYDLSGGSIPQTGSGVTVTIPAGSASVNVNFAALDDVDAEADNTLSITLVDGAAYDLGATTSSIATIPANDLVVTNTNNSGDGSLRQAITNANAFSTNDTITFTAVGSIGLTSALPDLANNGTLTINGGGTMTVTRTGGTFRIFTVASGANVTLNGLTITNGSASLGGGIHSSGTLNVTNSTISGNTAGSGGGIYSVSGTSLTVTNSIISNNTATTSGGGIRNSATLTVTNSTISGNSATNGGGIDQFNGSLMVTNSIISGNSAASYGGGIVNTSSTTIINSLLIGNQANGANAATDGGGALNSFGSSLSVTIVNSTIVENTAGVAGRGGLWIEAGILNLRNSIVANDAEGDCDRTGGTVNAQNSLVESGLSCVNGTNTNNLTGDPALNGDYTLSSSSIAIDAGSDALIPGGVTTDLAGNARIQGLRVDMGAYESSLTATPTVTISPAFFNVNEGSNADFTITRTGSTLADLTVTLSLVPSGLAGSDYSVSGGGISDQSGTVTVTIPAGSASVNVNFAAVDDVDAEADNQLSVVLIDQAGYTTGAASMTIATIPANDLVVTNTNDSGDGSLRQAITNANAFNTNDTITFTASGTITLITALPNLANNGTLTINGGGSITLQGGSFSIMTLADGANVALNGLNFTGASTGLGGGVYMNTGTLSVTNSSFSGMSTNGGGGIHNENGTLTVTGSQFTNNQALNGGGILNRYGQTTITNSTFSGNVLNYLGGGVFNQFGTVTIINSVFSGLRVSNRGAGIYNSGVLYVYDSTFSGNNGNGNAADIYNTSTANVYNSIFANSASGPNCVNSATINVQNSLIEDGSCGITGGVNGNLTGDPALNGDYTLSSSSIAIDAGSDALIPGGVTTDLAGNARIQGLRVDMGAYESSFTATPIVTISATDNAGAEAGSDPITFRISRTGSTAALLNVTYTINGDATNGTDYTPTLTGSVDIPAGQAFVDITITPTDDSIDEADETVTLTVIDGAAYDLGTTSSDTGTISDDDVAGIIITPTSGLITNEAGGTAQFTVVLNSQPSADVTIALSSDNTNEGTVAPSPLTFTPANWNTAQTVTVTGVDDSIDDGNISYTIITDTAVSADPNYSGLNPFDVSVTNNDNDSAGITVNPTSGLVTTEAGGTAQFTVVLNSQPSADVTIALSSSNTNEGTVAPTSLTFTPANWNIAQTVTVTGVDDFVDDGNIAYTIATASVVSADPNYSGLNPPNVSVTNNDDDSAGITVNPTNGLVTTEAGGTAQFTVVLNTQPTANVTIALSSSNTNEGTVAPTSLMFTPANWNIAQTVSVTGVDDLIVDGSVNYTIVTAAAVSADPNYSGLNPPNVSATNNDNDSAGITVNPTSGLVTTEAGGTAQFTVVLNTQPTSDVTIALSSSNTNEGTVAPTSLTFTPANWNTAQTVTVTGVDDLLVDGNIGYTIITAAAVSADPNYSGLNPSDVSVTNNDNDSAGITVNPTSGLVTTEAGGTAQFTVVLNSQPSADVTIVLSSDNTNEGTVTAVPLMFTSANWNTAQTVTVTGVDDLLVDGNIGYTIITDAAVSADPNYSGLNPSDVSVTNNDDDSAGITVNPTAGLVTTEAGGTAQFTVVLNTQPTSDVTIALSSSDTTEGTVTAVPLTFTSSNWNIAQTVTVTGVDDLLVDGNIGYTIITDAAVSSDPNYSGLNPSDVSVTNNDNDSAGITVNPTSGLVTTEAGGTAQFTVVLNTQPSADVTIALSSDNTNEGTVAPLPLTFTSSNWNTAQTVTVTGVDDLIVDGSVNYTIVTAAATSADSTYNGVNPSDVSVTNNDDDSAGITVNPTSGLVTTEAGGTAQFTVVLNTQPSADVTIVLSSDNTNEGTVAPSPLTFTPANWNIAQTVTVTGVDDLIVDGSVNYTIITAAAASADSTYNGVNPSDVSVTNNDDDSAGITVNPTSGLVTTEAGGTAQFTVVLNTQPSADVTIVLSSDNTNEGTVAPSPLTFTPANWNIAQTVSVTGVDDLIVDGSVNYTIVTAAAVSSDPNYSGLNPSDVSVTNNDDDSAGITVNPTSGLVTTEAGGTAQFTVVLNTQPSADVTIALSSDNTNEGTVAPLPLTFTSVNWNTPQTVTVTGVDDLLVDGNIGYTIITDAAVSADPNYSGLNPSDVSVTNNDDDTAGITVNPTSGLVTTEAGGTAQFTVVLNSQPSADVTIALSSDNTNEGTVAPSPLTFTSANWDTAQTVTVTGVDDLVDDGNIAYTIVTAAAVSTDPNYSGLNPSDVSVTNNDDDSVGITVNPTSGLVTTEAGGTAQFTVVLNTQPSADVTIVLSSDNTNEGTVAPSPLTFTPANWNIAQTVTITGVDDLVDDGSVAYTIITDAAASADPNYSGINPPDVSVTNNDDDAAGISVTPPVFELYEGYGNSYQIRLITPPTSAPITLLVEFDTTQLSINGNNAPFFITLSDTTPQTLSFNVLPTFDINTTRDLTITHTVFGTTAPEYPIGMAQTVTLRVLDYPAPPASPTCDSENENPDGVVRTGIPDALAYAINCRVLYFNGAPTSWLGNPLYSEANLGIPGLLDLGVQQAVDFFSPPPSNLTYFEGGAVFCVRGSGTLIWLASRNSPRIPEIIGSYSVSEFPGFTCSTLFEPGTLILVSENPLGE